MYSIIVSTSDEDSGWYLLPGDEWPGTVQFDSLGDAKLVAKQVIGEALSCDDESKILEARVVQLVEV